MNFKHNSEQLLKYAKAKAKFNEFNVPKNDAVRERIGKSHDLLFSTINVLSEFSEKYISNETIDEIEKELNFVSKFYENYVEAEEKQEDYFFYLTGACANFLSNNFGNSKALFDRILSNTETENEVSHVLIDCFNYIFYGQRSFNTAGFTNTDLENKILIPFIQELNTNEDNVVLIENLNNLVNITLKDWSPEASFFANILRAIHKKAAGNSATRIVPEKSNSTFSQWQPYFSKPNSIKVLWESQKLIVDKDILTGKDAIIQLPTGVGKTKSAELIIAAASLIRNKNISIVVSPLRSLCNEISADLKKSLKNVVRVKEISDVIQKDILLLNDDNEEELTNEDFDIKINTNEKQVIVLTPEKLYFLIRHTNELVQNCGLIIFDEAHMFDDSSRGITYELLIMKIKELLPVDAQKIFISAVLPNAEKLNSWLTNNGTIISNNEIKKTDKSVGFYSAINNKINFFESENFDDILTNEIFIPNAVKNNYVVTRYLRRTATAKAGDAREIFPNKKNATEIGLYLGLHVCEKGSVAIYFNKPKNIHNLSSLILKLKNANYPFNDFLIRSHTNIIEKDKLANLIKLHYGENNLHALAEAGILPHYGDLENGIRIAVEKAMKDGLISIVACTSTMAEGVNLPIRYLILTTFLDSKTDVFSARKFQNLFGRTARSGKYTEGSLLCSDAKTFDGRSNMNAQTGHNWSQIRALFDITQQDKCLSILNNLCSNLKIKYDGGSFNGLKFTKSLLDKYKNDENLSSETEAVIRRIKDNYPEQIGFLNQWDERIRERVRSFEIVVTTIESFILNEINDVETVQIDEFSETLFSKTLANIFADQEEKELLKSFFKIAGQKIISLDITKRSYYKNSLLGINDLILINNFIDTNPSLYNGGFDIEIWKNLCIFLLGENNYYLKEQIPSIITKWLSGNSYIEILNSLASDKQELLKLEKYCHNNIGFKLNISLNAVIEQLEQYDIDDKLKNDISLFQKKIKYGLPNSASVFAYESGFADRIIAQIVGAKLIEIKGNFDYPNQYTIDDIIENNEFFKEALKYYPSYFSDLMEGMR